MGLPAVEKTKRCLGCVRSSDSGLAVTAEAAAVAAGAAGPLPSLLLRGLPAAASWIAATNSDTVAAALLCSSSASLPCCWS